MLYSLSIILSCTNDEIEFDKGVSPEKEDESDVETTQDPKMVALQQRGLEHIDALSEIAQENQNRGAGNDWL